MLDNAAVDLKPVWLAICVIMGMTLFDFFAFFADKEFREMSAMAVVAGDESIEGFNAVNETKP